MSIGGGPQFAVAQQDEPLAPSTDRATDRPAAQPTRPTSQPPLRTEAAQSGNGLLVVVYGEDDAAVAEETVLRSLRTRRDVTVMDAVGLGIATGDDEAVRAAIAGDFGDLSRIVQSQGGEFLFVGSLETDARPPAIGPMFSGSASLELRMYRVSTGEVVQSQTFEVGMGGTPAKMGQTDADARTQAAREAGRLAATAARGWLARALR